LVKKLEFAGSRKRFDKTVCEHYHIRCEKCGRVEDIHCDSPVDIEKDIRDATDFEVIGHKVEFIGICPDCRKAGKKKSGSSRG
jgi:Fur family ferric uptake transcriptional regulator